MEHVTGFSLSSHLKKVNDKEERSGTGDQPVFKGVRCGCVVRPVKGISKMLGGSLMLNESYTHRNSAQALL